MTTNNEPVRVTIPEGSLLSAFKQINALINSNTDEKLDLVVEIKKILSQYDNLTEFTAEQLTDVFTIDKFSKESYEGKLKNKGFYLLDKEAGVNAKEIVPVMRIRNIEGVTHLAFGHIAHYFSSRVDNEDLKLDSSKDYLFLHKGMLDPIELSDLFINILNYQELYLDLTNFLNDRFLGILDNDLVHLKQKTDEDIKQLTSVGILSALGFKEKIKKTEDYIFPDLYYLDESKGVLSITPFVSGTLFKEDIKTAPRSLFRPIEGDKVVALDQSITKALVWPGDFYTLNYENSENITENNKELRAMQLEISRDVFENTYFIKILNDNNESSVFGTFIGHNEEFTELYLESDQNTKLILKITQRHIRWKYEFNHSELKFINLDDEIKTSLDLGDYELLSHTGFNTKYSATDAFNLIKEKKASIIYLDNEFVYWSAVKFTDKNNLHSRCLELMGVA